MTRELIRVMAENPQRICPHLHVSMQSGSDRVLRRMRRRWGARRFVDRCLLVRESLEQPAMTTDVIVGFPGETDQDFADTCRVVEEIDCSKIHVFPFSPRRTTPAAAMAEQVCPEVKSARVRELTLLANRLRDRYYRSLQGRALQVLVEPRAASRPGFLLGTSCRYAPVELPSAGARIREFVTVTAGDVVDGCIRAHAWPLNATVGSRTDSAVAP